MRRLSGAVSWVAKHPGLAVGSGILLIGLVLMATIWSVPIGFGSALAPAIGAFLFSALVSRHKRYENTKEDDTSGTGKAPRK